MFRLAHFSDVHLAPLPRPTWSQLASKRITGYLNWKLNREDGLQSNVLDELIAHMQAASPDHIALTGDLVNLALPEEIFRAREWLETLGEADEISVVPGNHDAYVPGALSSIINSWQPYFEGDDKSSEIQFPQLRIRKNIALISLNTGCATAPFMASGRFDTGQEVACEKMLADTFKQGKFRVILIHHPPFKNATSWSKRLIGAERFRAMVKRVGAELVLHGHTHINSFERIEGPNTEVSVVGVPSASKAPSNNSHGVPARYNLFNISGASGKWNCLMNEYGYSPGSNFISHINEQEILRDGKFVGGL